MQYIRERLSFNLSSNQTASGPVITNNEQQQPNHDTTDTPPRPPARKNRGDGSQLLAVTVSPTNSAFSEMSSQHPNGAWHRSKSIESPTSTYVTPFQSPVASEKWPSSRPMSVDSKTRTPDSSSIFVISRGDQLNGYPPKNYSTPIEGGGYVNRSFVNDRGASIASQTHQHNQAHVVHEQYWTWSCKCRRQFTNREKTLLVIIFFLLLVIGGLAAYLGIVSGNGNPLAGGLLTPGVLTQRVEE